MQQATRRLDQLLESDLTTALLILERMPSFLTTTKHVPTLCFPHRPERPFF